MSCTNDQLKTPTTESIENKKKGKKQTNKPPVATRQALPAALPVGMEDT